MEPVKLNFPPDKVLEVARGWERMAQKNKEAKDAEKAVLSDIVKMLEIAVSVMEPTRQK